MIEDIPSKIIVYVDGAARGNPGPAGAGILILNGKENTIKKYSEYLGDNLTNNQAEYKALIFSLKKIKLLFGKKNIKKIKVEINTDSELLLKQMQGKFKIKEPKIQSLFLETWNLKLDYKEINFKLIPRSKNEIADQLANQALDLKKKEQKLI